MKTLADRLEAWLRNDLGGAQWAWTRKELCHYLECSDRDLRRAKAELVERGVPVAAAPDGGYYLATTAEEMWAAYHQFASRIVKLAKRAQTFAREAADLESMQLILALLPDEEAASDG